MKKVQHFKKALIAMVVVAFSMSAPARLLANSAKSVQKDSITRVSYIGIQNQLPVVEIQIKNEEATGFIINVKDENGRLLYSEQLIGIKLSRKYALQSNDMEIAGTTFEITNTRNNETNVFKLFMQENQDAPILIAKVYCAR
jgi:hypothetical protein